MRPDATVIFIDNPFDSVVLASVGGFFRTSTFHEIGGTHFRVYAA